MKRLFVLIVLVMLAFWITASHRRPSRRSVGLSEHENSAHFVYHRHHGKTTPRFAPSAHDPVCQTLDEVRQALGEARDEVHQAFDEARDEFRQALHEVRGAIVSNSDQPHTPPLTPQLPGPIREDVEGLPVPIVPGTCVTNAEAKPPVQPAPLITVRHNAKANPKLPMNIASSPPASATPTTITGLISATEERAKADAHRQLRATVVDWLGPDVPASWTPPSRLLDTMVLETRIKPVVKDYGILYETELKVDASPRRRAAARRSVQPRAGRAAIDRFRRWFGLRPDLPGCCFRLYPR